MRAVVPMCGSLNVNRCKGGPSIALTAPNPPQRINKKNNKCLDMTWSIPHMPQPLQYPLRWISATIALALLLGLSWHTAARGQVPASLPVVERATHKSFVEKLAEDVSFEMLPIPGGVFQMG